MRGPVQFSGTVQLAPYGCLTPIANREPLQAFVDRVEVELHPDTLITLASKFAAKPGEKHQLICTELQFGDHPPIAMDSSDGLGPGWSAKDYRHSEESDPAGFGLGNLLARYRDARMHTFLTRLFNRIEEAEEAFYNALAEKD